MVSQTVTSVLETLPNEFNLAQYLLDRNKHQPKKVAFQSVNSGSYTYQQLGDLVASCTSYLQENGFTVTDRIALYLEDSIEFVVLFLAMLATGATPVLINPMVDTSTLEKILGDSASSAVFTSKTLSLNLDASLINTLSVSVNDLTSKSHDSGSVSFHLVNPESLAFIAYTSGSMGEPKGVMHMHYSPIVACRNYAVATLGITQLDTVLSGPPLAFTYGLGTTLYMPMYVGATSLLCPDKTAFGLLRVLNKFNPTVFFGVPSHYAGILSVSDIARICNKRLRLSVSAGEKLPASVSDSWFDKTETRICEGVGTTESTHIFISNRPGACNVGSVGFPVCGYEVIPLGVNSENDALFKIKLKGEGIMLGYWNKPKETAGFLQDGCLLFNDLYYKDQQGRYYIAGRQDQLIKLRGMWLLPSKIESEVLKMASVAKAVLCPVESLLIDNIVDLLLFVEPREQSSDAIALKKSIKKQLQNAFPKYMVPKAIDVVPQFRMGPTGKVDRNRMIENYWKRRKDEVC